MTTVLFFLLVELGKSLQLFFLIYSGCEIKISTILWDYALKHSGNPRPLKAGQFIFKHVLSKHLHTFFYLNLWLFGPSRTVNKLKYSLCRGTLSKNSRNVLLSLLNTGWALRRATTVTRRATADTSRAPDQLCYMFIYTL